MRMRDHAIQLIDEERARAKKDFGNGRTVRNLVEKVEKELAMRLEDENKLGNNHGLSTDELKKALTTITLADMQKVNLEGLKAKPSKGIGLGASFDAVKAHDGQKPAANGNTPTAKKKHGGLSL